MKIPQDAVTPILWLLKMFAAALIMVLVLRYYELTYGPDVMMGLIVGGD